MTKITKDYLLLNPYLSARLIIMTQAIDQVLLILVLDSLLVTDPTLVYHIIPYRSYQTRFSSLPKGKQFTHITISTFFADGFIMHTYLQVAYTYTTESALFNVFVRKIHI